MLQEEMNQLELDQQLENELTKLRLAARFGTVVTGQFNLPASLEARWLNRLEGVEHAFSGAEKTTVAAFLGNPVFRAESALSDRVIRNELEKLTQRLLEAGIEVSTLYAVPPRDLYRYLTEEFLQESIDDIQMEGINQHFVYEEFYPNEEFEVEHTIVEFFDMLFGKYYAMLESIMYSDSGEPGDSEELTAMVDRLCEFTDSFDEIELLEFSMESIRMSGPQQAVAEVRVAYIGYPNRRGKGFTFSGTAQFALRMDRYEYWAIESVDLPGVFDPGKAA